MGDVAQILGINTSTNNENTTTAEKDGKSNNTSNSTGTITSKSNKQAFSYPPPEAPSSHSIPLSIQNTSTVLSKPVLKILSGKVESQNHAPSSTLPPIVPSHNLPLQTIKKRRADGTPATTSNINSSSRDATSNLPSSSVNNQPSFVKINNKSISTKKARSWIYAPFSNSARKDGLLLHHWVRAGVEYPEYPYARFDIHLEELSYKNEALEIENVAAMRTGRIGDTTVAGIGGGHGNGIGSGRGTTDPNAIANNSGGNTNSTGTTSVTNSGSNSNSNSNRSEEEVKAATDLFYQQYLQNDNWTQSETDTLLELCRVYELRWPVIADRWIGKFGSFTSKKVEDLQHQYYTIGYILNRMKVERAAKVEAENLAKAMAVANQNIPSVSSVMRASSTSIPTSVPPPLNDTATMKANENLQAEHSMASAIASSSSSATIPSAVNTLVGDVKANLQPPIPATNTGTSNQPTFDLEVERQRRKVLDIIWARTKEEELEEIELRNELKLVETQIRKLKKSGGHILAAAAAASKSPQTVGGTNSVMTANNATLLSSTTNKVIRAAESLSLRGQPSTTSTDNCNNTTNTTATTTNNKNNTSADASYDIVNAQFATTAPTPTPGTPYLQSGRQKQPATGGQMGINKTTLKRMDQILQELNIKERPIPTKRVCDLYDHVRKGALMLLTLQKIMLKKESDVISRRMKLDKMSGSVVKQMEAAAAAAAKAASQAAAAAAAEKAATSNTSKSNKTTTGTGGGKGSAGGGSNSGGNGISTSTTGGSKKSSGKAAGKAGGTKEKKKKKASSSEGGPTKKRKTTSKKNKEDGGTSTTGTTPKGASSKGTASKGSASKGTTSKGSGSKSSASKGNTSKGSSPKGSTLKGFSSKGVSSKGVATKGVSKVASKGVASKGIASKAAAPKSTTIAAPKIVAGATPNASIVAVPKSIAGVAPPTAVTRPITVGSAGAGTIVGVGVNVGTAASVRTIPSSGHPKVITSCAKGNVNSSIGINNNNNNNSNLDLSRDIEGKSAKKRAKKS